MKILFVASEGLPFSKTGGLADVVEALPKALVAAGHQVVVVLPRYRGTKVAGVALPSVTIAMGATQRFPSLADGGDVDRVRYFFVDDPEYFDREQLYGVKGIDYPDNPERFGEFSKAAIELAKRVWQPDVIHCHDWQSALVPVMLRTIYATDPLVGNLPVVFTVHNLGYHGLFPRDILGKLGLPDTLFHMEALEFYAKVNFLKGGLVYSDYLTTVSRKYAQEIQTAEYGHGLEGVIRKRADRLVGILNGVDYSAWSPEVDPFTAAKYSTRDLQGKKVCKKDLLQTFKLPSDPAAVQRPLIGIVSRFADQKGFDLIAKIAPELMKEDMAIAALGAGEPKYEQLFKELATRYPTKVSVQVKYDNVVAHKIEAGSDMFLMPSRYEPCGLNQIYSLRYGTVPIVRATGGLDDTIEPFNAKTEHGTGFKFTEYDGAALLACIREALGVYKNAVLWQILQRNGMAKDYSWGASAGTYVKVYEAAMKARNQKPAGSSN